jgi:hypothetical protein
MNRVDFFSAALVATLRRFGPGGHRRLSRPGGQARADLNAQVTKKLHRLKHDEAPMLVGAKSRIAQQLPWGAAASPATSKVASGTRRKQGFNGVA